MKKYSTNILAVFIIFFLCASVLLSQNRKAERAREHQAVEDLLNSMRSNNSSTFSAQSTTGVNKYDQFKKFMKVTGEEDRKSFIMNGNNITCEVENYGGIGPGLPGEGFREVANMVWNNAPYIFQFTPIIGASVPAENNPDKRLHIITDGLFDYDGKRDESLTGKKWVWQPLPGFADPDQPYMASNPAPDTDRDGKPDSWPRNWYSDLQGEYVWPGLLTQGENNSDLETFWVMDDRDNSEFKYYPFLNDTTRRGLGVQVEGRAFQWSNSLAANALFVVYSITNVSDKDLDSVLFGIYGDPDIGGTDNDDDEGQFIPPFSIPGVDVENIPVYSRSMVYLFDQDRVGDRGVELGYLGCKFLESPGRSDDGIDNDGDGLIDERQDDGIDNDGDWNIETDDVGIDGVANTGDAGEGDGVPTAGRRLLDGSADPLFPGEPNFEFTDLDESDQIGLTSFNSWIWGDEKVSDDESLWQRSKPGNFDEVVQKDDITFVFGSGYISLKKGETKRISMAFLFGEDLQDLLVNAETVQDIYNKNYRFFRPPDLPNVTAVAENKKVTLYWDTTSEESIDPITGQDFEGYVIYRSSDPDFSDIKTVTDGRGASFLFEPLKQLDGFEAKWDLNNDWIGYHPVPYQGRGVNYYIGDNTGLVHSYVDSNEVHNGQTYYYAVVAYDHGDSLGIPPSETTKKISVDPITGELRFDPNTVQVIPGPRTSGYVAPTIAEQNIEHVGYGNGVINFEVINDLNVIDNQYVLTFADSYESGGATVQGKNITVKSANAVEETFYLFDTKYTTLARQNIIDDDELVVSSISGTAYTKGTDYDLDYKKGKIKRLENSSMPNNSEYKIVYNYYPVYQSTAIHGEDSNPVFDGIRLTVNDFTQLGFDSEKSKWEGGLEIPFNMALSSLGSASSKTRYPADYTITFDDNPIYTAKKVVPGKGIIEINVNYKVEEVTTGVPQPIVTLLNEKEKNDSSWTRGDEIIFFYPGSEGKIGELLTWGVTVSRVTETDSTYPGTGDILHVYTERPFSTEDVFTLTTSPGRVSNSLAKSSLDKIRVVPNPYIAFNELEPPNRLSNQNRGERRIYFDNLPQECSIRIFTLTGELVAKLDHQTGFDNGREYWNLLNKDGFGVAYGLYLAHIEAPGIGERILKFALIK